MEQTRQHKTAKVILTAVLTFVVTLAMIFAILPATTLTAYATATELAADTVTWENGDYVVPAGGVTIGGHITVNGTVNLTLTEGATLTANMGITLSDGATLNVSGEGAMVVKGSNGNANSTVAGTGTLVLTSGTVTVTGGNGGDTSGIRESSEAGGAAINGAVTVNGGTLTATGGRGGNLGERSAYSTTGAGGAAISGSVTINAGTVTATGGNGGTIGVKSHGAVTGAGGAGIDGSVTVKGGKLTTTNGTGGGGQNDGTRGAGGKAVKGPNKTALYDAITAAETLYDSIKDNNDYTEIANTLKSAIDNAKAVAESDEVDQDAVDTATTNITTAKTTAEADKKDVDDTAAANAVKEKIAAIGTVEYTTESKGKIDEARTAYNGLTDDQKALVDTYETLTTAETTYAAEKKTTEDNAAANVVKEKIAAIGTVEYTTESKGKIDEAKAAYDALTADQKALVDTYETLTTAESAYNTLKADNDAADEVKALIAAIGEVAYTTESKGKIDEARAAYNGLTDDQKALVDNYATLTTAETTYAAEKKTAEDNAAANVVKEKIAAIGTVAYTTESKGKIDEARTAYDGLTDDQKALVDNYATLTTAETTYAAEKKTADDNAAANAVKEKIAAIGTVAYTTESKGKIDEAKVAYEALTADQKALVDTYETLTTAESTYNTLKADNDAADEVKALITAIGTVEYTTESKDKIDEAKAAYEALTADQKALVDTYETLTTAESTYNTLKADNDAADEVKALITAIGDVTYTTESKGKIDEAKAAYDALSEEQKALVTNYTVLTTADSTYTTLKADNDAADEVKALVAAIGDVAYSTESKAQIDAAREAYDALTADQKALVTNYETLTSAEGSYTDLKVAKEAEDAINALPASENIAGTDKAAVAAAQAKYDALTPAQKEIVSAETVAKLAAANNMVAVQEVVVSIGDIDASNPDGAKVTEARAAYDALTDEQKAKVTNYETLTTAESKLVENNNPEKQGLSGGAIAGIVIGCFFGLLIIACAVLFILNKKGIVKIAFIDTATEKVTSLFKKK